MGLEDNGGECEGYGKQEVSTSEVSSYREATILTSFASLSVRLVRVIPDDLKVWLSHAESTGRPDRESLTVGALYRHDLPNTHSCPASCRVDRSLRSVRQHSGA